MEYNEKNELTKKHLHGDAVSAIQTIDYQYNIRGWTTHINNPDNPGQDVFTMQLFYNESESGLTDGTPQYNGNIRAMKWNTIGDVRNNYKRGYSFDYDALNRLTEAFYTENEGYGRLFR